ncbi:unnamed protein product, partial [Boreogadus saida]
ELRELSGGHREMSGGHREMSGGHRELREMSGDHRELRELSGGHREMSGGHREQSGGHRELSGGHREQSGGHREQSGGHREQSGGHRELSGGHRELSGGTKCCVGAAACTSSWCICRWRALVLGESVGCFVFESLRQRFLYFSTEANAFLSLNFASQLVIRRGLGRFQTVTSGHEAVGTLCKLFTGATPEDNPHLPLRLPLLVCNDAYPVHSTPPPAGQNNACFTPAATPDSGPNCSPTPSPSRRAFPDIMASLDVQPRLMEARPDPDTPAQMRAAVARYLVANALKDKALSTASPSPIHPNNKSTPSPIQPNNKSTPSPIQPNNNPNQQPQQLQPNTQSYPAQNQQPQQQQPYPHTHPAKTSTSVNSSCNPTPNPTQPRTSRPKEEWLEHLIHHFNLSKKKQKKETQQEGSLGELLKQMCKMNIEKDMEAIRQLKERAEENLDLMAMMSLMTHQQETFPQVTPLPEWIRQGNLPTTYTTYVAVAMEQPSTKQNYPYGRGRPGRDEAMRLFPCMHCNQMGH